MTVVLLRSEPSTFTWHRHAFVLFVVSASKQQQLNDHERDDGYGRETREAPPAVEVTTLIGELVLHGDALMLGVEEHARGMEREVFASFVGCRVDDDARAG